jgi:hypothetical protein
MVGFLYILAAFIIFIVVATIVFQWRMGKHRGVSREEFIAAFADAAIPTEIPAAVYDYYKRGVISKNFSVAPGDSYEHVLHEGHEDIEDDGQHLVRKLGMELPTEPVLREWEKPLETLRDMVLWLNWIRQHQPSQQVAGR